MKHKYRVITLCGSTKFRDDFLEMTTKLTLEGNVVISVGVFGHSGDAEKYAIDYKSSDTKEMLDAIHKQKIDMADAICIINRNGYIGSSTKSEIEYARAHGKDILWMDEGNIPPEYA